MMDHTRRTMWLAWGLAGGVLVAGCEPRENTGGPGGNPSADDRERRSGLLNDLMASRERAPDPEALRGPDAQGVSAPGQGGSGRPEPTGSVRGRVEWVGDNELLIRDDGGEERDVEVVPATLLLLKGRAVGLPSMREGDVVNVTYDDGPGGWVAREVDVVLPPPGAPTGREGPERDNASRRP